MVLAVSACKDSHYPINEAFKSQQWLPSREWITNLVSQYPVEPFHKMTQGEVGYHDWRSGSFLPSQIGMPWRIMACLPYLAPGVPSVITQLSTEQRKPEVFLTAQLLFQNYNHNHNPRGKQVLFPHNPREKVLSPGNKKHYAVVR